MPRYGVQLEGGKTHVVEADRPASAMVKALAMGEGKVEYLWDIEDFQRPNPLEHLHDSVNRRQHQQLHPRKS